ncbi:MAG: hypothetical protein NZM35_10370 [Chitinophagales bacterium]|nr:hypothetical protein [Chitinophagales bacterium]MDW8419732.1 hypothetical protein [Chitinophagales bacterium]
MKNILRQQIKKYKSVKGLHLQRDRINFLIGAPNAGNLNKIEALNLSYLSWILHGNVFLKLKSRKLNCKEYFRVKSAADLLHLGNLSEPITNNYFGFCSDTFKVK